MNHSYLFCSFDATVDYTLSECQGYFDEIVGSFPMERPQLSLDGDQTLNVYVCYAESASNFFVVEENEVDRYFR
jgi:hypothetical protein